MAHGLVVYIVVLLQQQKAKVGAARVVTINIHKLFGHLMRCLTFSYNERFFGDLWNWQ